MDEKEKDLKPEVKEVVPEVKPEIVKTYTEDEYKAQLQSQTDKRVSQSLETSKAKWLEEYEAKLVSEKSEAEKLGAMTAEERSKAELDKQRKEFETERQSFQKERMELQTIKELSAEGLPTEFSSYVTANTADDTSANIKAFKQQWSQAIESALDERLKGKTPMTATALGASITKEQFNKMNYKERAKLIEEDPETYQMLKG